MKNYVNTSTFKNEIKTINCKKTLEEIQVDTVPNPEPIGISNESKVNYLLILCGRYSRIFRAIGLKDKSLVLELRLIIP